ncbi:hypothetical protein BSR28_02375 [Boudabousia liubingyangii]|uniref:D-alanine--D-alanine ligase family protein n=1 Tax=Boudabousia liubingyangii TaxID=1921764 RepID=UPI000939CEC5|nr:ATP-grasp domain-containing protein [Boudabousia liubingyangii]OKL48550.1 hypothetical protein BSR28_02375 [Boudabousia liubingyangii]
MTELNVSRETISEAAVAASTEANSAATKDGLRIAVITGGVTHERDISLKSAHTVALALRNAGFEVEVLDFDSTLIPNLRKGNFDLAWPLVHGGIGEDGSLQTIPPLLSLPFVGTPAEESSIASFKPHAKAEVLRAGGLSPEAVALPRALFKQVGAPNLIDAIVSTLDFPLVVKPANGGSSLGVTRVKDVEELRLALIDAFAYCDTAMVEKLVHGKEIAVSLADQGDGLKALPPVEIEIEGGEYDFSARYETGRSIFYAPARLSETQLQAVTEAAELVGQVLGMRHFARIDLILDDQDRAWFIDANVTPGMTEMSLFPQAAEAATGLESVLMNIVRQAAQS